MRKFELLRLGNIPFKFSSNRWWVVWTGTINLLRTGSLILFVGGGDRGTESEMAAGGRTMENGGRGGAGEK